MIYSKIKRYKIRTYCLNVECLAVSSGKHDACPYCGSSNVTVIKKEIKADG
jgi:rRNA maturation endonuclease Nob1